jgi:tetratricopeptide (TPR) repeat protein
MSGDIGDTATAIFEYARKRRFHEALAICDKILIGQPSNIIGHYMKYIVLGMMGKKTLAKKSLNRAIQIEQHPMLYFMRAHAAMNEGRFEDAASDLERAASCDDGSYAAPIAFLRAECCLENHEFEKGCEQCEKMPADFAFPGFKATSRRALLDRLKNMSK